MGNNQICKECETIATANEGRQTAQSSARQAVTVTAHDPNSTVQLRKRNGFPKVEQLADARVRISYDNGEVYEGEVQQGFKEGTGRMLWPSGACYEGQWKRDRACGQGVFRQNGSTYAGQFEGDELVHGKFTSADESEIYEGYFKNHKFEGEGTLTKRGFYRYEGGFRDNLKEGRGKIVFQGGDEFEGEFKRGKFEGYGVFRSKSHEYEGDFRNGEYHGKGKYSWSSGNYYEGNYDNGEKSGFGVYVCTDGTRYEGNWQKGKRHGEGYEVAATGERSFVRFEMGTKLQQAEQ